MCVSDSSHSVCVCLCVCETERERDSEQEESGDPARVKCSSVQSRRAESRDRELMIGRGEAEGRQSGLTEDEEDGTIEKRVDHAGF